MSIAQPKIGEIYRHFKGRMYAIVQIARHSETLELYVVYESLDGNHTWIRPLNMFCEHIEKDGKKIQRFTRVQANLLQKK